MKERPILFSGPMVRAILDGRKTQTRRSGKIQSAHYQKLGISYVQHQTKGTVIQATYDAYPGKGTARWAICECPYGIPGDRLWVRETWTPVLQNAALAFRADGHSEENSFKWKPSIHMPRRVSRITLEITAIRVERLQSITLGDIVKEGLAKSIYEFKPAQDGIRQWQELWDSINAKDRAAAIRGDAHPWESNPWVWVIEFRKL